MSYSSMVIADGAVGFWPLTDAAAPYVDIVGAHNLSVGSGSATPQNATLILGTPTVSLNGTLTGTRANNGLAATWTLECWVQIAADQTNGLLCYQGDNASNGWGMFVSAHHSGGAGSELQGLFGSVGFVDSAPTTLTHSTVLYLAMAYNAGSTQLYLNGVAVGAPTSPLVPNTPANTTTFQLVGDIGYAAVYDTTLSAGTILTHYNTGIEVDMEPLPITWTGSDFLLDSILDPLPITWTGGNIHMPVLPPPFPSTGRRAVLGSRPYTVSFVGADTDSVSGFNRFRIIHGADQPMTALVTNQDGDPGFPPAPDLFWFRIYNTPQGVYDSDVTAYDAAAGTVSFTIFASNFLPPGVYFGRLMAEYNILTTDDFLSFPTLPVTVEILET